MLKGVFPLTEKFLRKKNINDCDWSRQIFHGRKFKKLKIFNFLQWLFLKTFCPRKYFSKWEMALRALIEGI